MPLPVATTENVTDVSVLALWEIGCVVMVGVVSPVAVVTVSAAMLLVTVPTVLVTVT